MRFRLYYWLLLILAMAACAVSSTPEPNAERLESWLSYLASDEMAGRANGSPQLETAANWLADRYREVGLTPLPGREDFFQRFEFERDGKTFPSANVLGFMEGSDPTLKDQYIVLSAHYDHVGEDPSLSGDTVFNGADDNASGVTTMLGIAATLNRLGKQDKPGRSIVFIAWSGEEMGLRGSRHYRDHPFLPLEKMMVNLNFEMVGHSAKTGKNKVWLTGHNYSNLSELVEATATANGWQLVADPFTELNLFFRSDNVSFAMLESNREERSAVGIPAHTFSTWGNGDHYHQPHDEAAAIDFANMAGLVKVMTQMTVLLSNHPQPVQWRENEFIKFSRPELNGE